jgi:chorismate mutase
MSSIRGIRGATVIKKNSKADILSATIDLLEQMTSLNNVRVDDIASVIFSVTKDLNAEFPATAARKLGWTMTPLLCSYEINVPGGLKKCIRVLMHVNTNKAQRAIKNVYLGKAKKLRPDLG